MVFYCAKSLHADRMGPTRANPLKGGDAKPRAYTRKGMVAWSPKIDAVSLCLKGGEVHLRTTKVLISLLSLAMVGALAVPAYAHGRTGSYLAGTLSSQTFEGSHKAEAKHSTIEGTISAASTTSITINGQQVPLSPNVQIRYHDKVVAPGAIPTGVTASAKVDSTGAAVEITLRQDPNIPKGESYVSTITAVYGSSITIGQYTLTINPNATVKYGDRTLAIGAIPIGVQGKVSLDRNSVVTGIKIFSDPAIPKGESARGTITAVSSTSITVGPYTLALSSSTTVKYHDFWLSVSQVPAGVQAKVKVGKDLSVTQIKLMSDPNLPNSKSLRGTVSALGTGTITVSGYTLTLDPSAVADYKGNSLPLSSVQVGWDVKLHLSTSGTVVEIQVKQGPQSSSSQSGN